MAEKVGRANLHEVVSAAEFFAEAVVEGNTIQNVSLLGPRSLNGRVYTQDAMQDAVRLYNGVQVFADHPGYGDLTGTGGRKFMDLAGKILNTRLSGDRVRGDVILIEGEPVGDKLKTIAEQMPDLVGFSHRAKGEVEAAEDGTVIVKRLTEVSALEIVVDPATTNGLFESIIEVPEGSTLEQEAPAMEMKDLTLKQLRAERPDLVDGISSAAVTEAAADGAEQEALTELKATVATLTTENDGLKTAVDGFEASEALRERDALISTKLADAKLPEQAITERFQGDLQRAKDEAEVDAIIADRQALVEKLPKEHQGQPRQPARKVSESTEDGDQPKPVTDEVMEQVMTRRR